MHLLHRPAAVRTAAALCALGLLEAVSGAGAELTVTRVDFTPAVTAKLQEYGESEGAAVRAAILTEVSRASQPQSPPRLSVAVTVTDLAASRLTRKQLNDDPSLDVVSSKSLGGAELKGEVRDAQQHLLTIVSYRYFAPDITAGSPARDPWADARVAIAGFAAKLAATVRDLPSISER
jgi:hypothetical protein